MNGDQNSDSTPAYTVDTTFGLMSAHKAQLEADIELASPPDAIALPEKAETIHHPQHYGGGDNPYEAIKVIEAWGLGFHLGNTVKYIARAGKKGNRLEDLKKAAWYLNREIENEDCSQCG